MKLFTRILALSTLMSSTSLAQAPQTPTLGAQGDAMFKQNKFSEAIALYDKALAQTKTDSAEQVIKKYKLLSSKGWALMRLKQKEESYKLLELRYEMIADAAKKYPENLTIAKAQISDLGQLARKYDIRKEFDKVATIQLQAVALADAQIAKHPNNQSLLLTQYNTRLNLAKSYRWNKQARPKTTKVVKDGLAILEKIDPASLPKGVLKEHLTLQLTQLQVAVLSLNKEYEKSLKLSTELLDATKPLVLNKNVSPYQISALASSMYHHAFLLEKLGRANEAQLHLKNLLKMLDVALTKFPDNVMLTNSKTHYQKYLGKALK